jgi:hypothetical protein
LWGAITPDFPLVLLSIFGGMYFRSTGMTTREAANHMFEKLYFSDPGWISAHHLFHAPFLLAAYTLILYPLRKHRVAYWLLWFVAGCSLHSLVDILTHYDDGPLVFFPLNWTYRFHSISYWEYCLTQLFVNSLAGQKIENQKIGRLENDKRNWTRVRRLESLGGEEV